MANHGGDMFIKALQDRFTCKRYAPEGHISDSDFNTILEAARLSPSSFGMEPWKLLVVENQELLQQLLDCSWGAKKNADRTVILLARKNLTAQSEWAHDICHNVQGLSPQDEKARLEMFQTFQERDLRVLETCPQTLDPKRALFDWASKQTYIALANMLSTAAVMGIDATPGRGLHLPRARTSAGGQRHHRYRGVGCIRPGAVWRPRPQPSSAPQASPPLCRRSRVPSLAQQQTRDAKKEPAPPSRDSPSLVAMPAPPTHSYDLRVLNTLVGFTRLPRHRLQSPRH